MDGEERYRLLLTVSEAANAHLRFEDVVAAVSDALAPFVAHDAVAVVAFEREALRLRALHARGRGTESGASAWDALQRFNALPKPQVDEQGVPVVPMKGSATEHVAKTRRAWVCQDLEKEKRFVEDERLLAYGVKAYVRCPLFVRERLVGSISFTRFAAVPFAPEEVALLEDVSRPVASAVANSLAYEEIGRLKALLEEENVALREERDLSAMHGEIVGSSKALKAVLARVEKVARTDSTVLLLGETGTGKELIAGAIHRRSARAKGPLVKVNCAALPPSLIASELFGHEKGAFTGALERRAGRFELANGGTLFLDEVGDLPADVQAALLRAIQEKEFERVGGTRTLRSDARIVAATNRDLKAEVARGGFRNDLYYRLAVFPITLPPLRERPEDVPVLVEYFAARHGARLGKRFLSVEKRTLERLAAYPWPGNVRELENVVERAAILSDGNRLVIDDGALGGASPERRSLPHEMRDGERRAIEEALAASRGRVSGTRGAAARLGVPASTLESRIKALDIEKHRFRG